jgi:CheY-like chemotaxis protein
MPRVLVIDDDLMVAQLLREHLTNEGLAVETANHGEEGFSCAVANPPDLIMLDVNLPDATGFQMCGRFREHPTTRAIPIIMMTGAARFPNQQAIGRSLGANDYVLKPFDVVKVGEQVHKLIGSTPGPKPAEIPAPQPQLQPLPEPAQAPAPPLEPQAFPSAPATDFSPFAPLTPPEPAAAMTTQNGFFPNTTHPEMPAFPPAPTASAVPVAAPLPSVVPVTPRQPDNPFFTAAFELEKPSPSPAPVREPEPEPEPEPVKPPKLTPIRPESASLPLSATPFSVVPRTTEGPSPSHAAPPAPSPTPATPAPTPEPWTPRSTPPAAAPASATPAPEPWTPRYTPSASPAPAATASESWTPKYTPPAPVAPTPAQPLEEEAAPDFDSLPAEEDEQAHTVSKRMAAFSVVNDPRFQWKLTWSLFGAHILLSLVNTAVVTKSAIVTAREVTYTAGGWALLIGLLATVVAVANIRLDLRSILRLTGLAAIPIVFRTLLLLAANVLPGLSEVRESLMSTSIPLHGLLRPLDLFEVISVVVLAVLLRTQPGSSLQKALSAAAAIGAVWILVGVGFFRPL